MNRSKQVMTVFMAIFISVFMAACKTTLTQTDIRPDGTQRKIELEIELPPMPGDGGGTKSNEEVKEENENKGASFMYIHTGGSNVNLSEGEVPQIILTLTKISNDIIFFSNPAEVDMWAEPYLELTDGIKLETTLTVERIPGLNTIVVKAYYDSILIDATASSEWVTDLEPETENFGGGE